MHVPGLDPGIGPVWLPGLSPSMTSGGGNRPTRQFLRVGQKRKKSGEAALDPARQKSGKRRDIIDIVMPPHEC
jgi:hypothetical protein